MGTTKKKLKSATLSPRYLVVGIWLAIFAFVQADLPKTQEEVNAIATRGRTDPNALWELKGASLDLIMSPLTYLWFGSARAAYELETYRKRGDEKQFIAEEKTRGRDVVGLANRLPIIQNILMSDPNFEWTVASKLSRMTYDLNQTFEKTKLAHATDLVQEMEFVSMIPGDAAIRIIGSCLEAPHFPPIDHGDAWETSPANRAREILARVVKKRFGEDVPEDVEAARAWWKENGHRFAQKQTTPGTPGTGNGAPRQNNASATANSPSPSSPKASPATAQETNPTDAQSQAPLRWLTGTALAAALAAAFILIARARK